MTPAWRTLKLNPDTPRPESLLDGINLMYGLRGWQGFGWLAWMGALMAIGALLIPGEAALKLFGAIALASIGLVFQLKTRKQLALRRQALLTGIPVNGSVVRHTKRLNPFSSQSHLIITGLFWLSESEQIAKGILWRREALRDLPKGRQILGLWLPDSNQIWLPLELGIRLDAEPLLPPEKVLEDTQDESLKH